MEGKRGRQTRRVRQMEEEQNKEVIAGGGLQI